MKPTAPVLDRRRFLNATGIAFAALATHGCVMGEDGMPGFAPYGPLRSDPDGLLDLPTGFSYRIVSRLGDVMDDGLRVPDLADGMGCFAVDDGLIALVRNHELSPGADAGGPVPTGFDMDGKGNILPGGTTTIVLDPETLRVVRQYRSLGGTIRNCAGGTTPWNSWLTCEEDVTRAGTVGKDHGWVFEVPAGVKGLVDAIPITGMGRFNHEAVAIDPRTGVAYLTEDRADGLLYRYLPRVPSELLAGGRLQALCMGDASFDTRNWTAPAMDEGQPIPVRWIDLDDVDAPDDDLRQRGAVAGAAIFARGEGIHMGDGELYFCCTSGGAAKAGQIFRLVPGQGGDDDRIDLFFESRDAASFDYGDNLTIAPNGHLIVCEDQGRPIVDNHLRGISPDGTPYTLARLRIQTELAGACFSPDGRILFVNAQSPTATIAIQGPWLHREGA